VLSVFLLWHTGPWLDNDRETNNETIAVVRQRPARNDGSTVWSGVFNVNRFEVVSRDWPSSVGSVQCSAISTVERVDRWTGELVRGPLRFSPFELLLLEAGSWSTEIIRELWIRGTSAVGSPYQATTGEDTAEWEALVRAVVNCRLCEIAITL
jgi:hypothetical protein